MLIINKVIVSRKQLEFIELSSFAQRSEFRETHLLYAFYDVIYVTLEADDVPR